MGWLSLLGHPTKERAAANGNSNPCCSFLCSRKSWTLGGQTRLEIGAERMHLSDAQECGLPTDQDGCWIHANKGKGEGGSSKRSTMWRETSEMGGGLGGCGRKGKGSFALTGTAVQPAHLRTCRPHQGVALARDLQISRTRVRAPKGWEERGEGGKGPSEGQEETNHSPFSGSLVGSSWGFGPSVSPGVLESVHWGKVPRYFRKIWEESRPAEVPIWDTKCGALQLGRGQRSGW